MIAVELRHGFTLAEVHDVARFAVHLAGPMAGSWWQRYETAWSEIVLHLYTVEYPPQRYELIRAGRLALYDAMTDDRHHYGYYKYKTYGGEFGVASSPPFMKFWWDQLTTCPPFENTVIERVALAQVWMGLSATDRRMLAACAAHDNDYRAAAAAAGVTDQGFRHGIARARCRALELWYGDETHHQVGHYVTHRLPTRQPECGTMTAVWWHRRHKQNLCERCAPVDSEYNRRRRNRSKAVSDV